MNLTIEAKESNDGGYRCSACGTTVYTNDFKPELHTPEYCIKSLRQMIDAINERLNRVLR